jgi:hypothetical protein
MMFEHDRPYRVTYGCFADGVLAEIFLDTGKPDATIQMHADESAVVHRNYSASIPGSDEPDAIWVTCPVCRETLLPYSTGKTPQARDG